MNFLYVDFLVRPGTVANNLKQMVVSAVDGEEVCGCYENAEAAEM